MCELVLGKVLSQYFNLKSAAKLSRHEFIDNHDILFSDALNFSS